ncbi:hypothetical protein BRCH_02425c [Candidatus Burkholderia brachyanthoides]|nr:hypothetical protein BRCH_02425c [Candidatus Burkholderia brachyanthoides]
MAQDLQAARRLHAESDAATYRASLLWRARGSVRTQAERLSDRCFGRRDEARAPLHEDLNILSLRVATIWNSVPEFMRLDHQQARRHLKLAAQKSIDRFVAIARKVGERLGERVQFVCIGNGDFTAASGVTSDALPANLHVAGPIPDAPLLRRACAAQPLRRLPLCLSRSRRRQRTDRIDAGCGLVLVKGFDTGIVVENRDDPTDFATVVALATDPAHLALLRANCTIAAAHFTAERMIDETLAVYRQSIARNKV